ncbi:MAG: hypothetical protein H0W23_01780 [Chloroflexia bacterium]|nr:hypothetical protein [Chloroflexia bacterium]
MNSRQQGNFTDASSPIAEAIQILDDVVRECNLGEPEVETVLRRCSHAALLLGDHTAHEHFWMEINGFPRDAALPPYRVVSGMIRWKSPSTHEFDSPNDIGAKRKEQEFGAKSATPSEFRGTRESLLQFARGQGFRRSAPGLSAESVSIEVGHAGRGRPMYRHFSVEPWEYYSARDCGRVVNAIREDAYNWAVPTLIRIKYENRITGLWDKYRSEVDSKLSELELTNHLGALDRQLGSSNEQEWRSALYSCRNMLRDVADYLWKDPNKTVRLPDKDGKMVDVPVDMEKYILRLKAYLFYKTKSTDETRLSRSEAELLGELIGRVNTVDNNAHEKTDRRLAESAALHTYMVIADLIQLTDMVPVADVSIAEK